MLSIIYLYIWRRTCIEMIKVKRVKSEVECGFCGYLFMQTRWWQVFCSSKCRKTVEKNAKSRVKVLEEKNRMLREKIERMEKNALDHSGGGSRSFRYDNEDQSQY
jgi:hypothetical protein